MVDEDFNHELLDHIEHLDRGVNLDPPTYETLNIDDSGEFDIDDESLDDEDDGNINVDNQLFMSNSEVDQMIADENITNSNTRINSRPRRRRRQNNKSKLVRFHNDTINAINAIKTKLHDYIYIPSRILLIDPFLRLYYYLSFRFEYHLKKIGNPVIIKRFVYVFMMSIFVYFVYMFTNSEENNGTIGKFTDHDEFLHYAKKCIDLKKFEQDLEYISSMSHQPGTIGNQLITNYMQDSFSNNGIKNLGIHQYDSYLNYPSDETEMFFYNDKEERVQIDLNFNNFNPMSINGSIEKTKLYYANLGRDEDYKKLKDVNFEEIAVLLKYDNELVSEQILVAENLKIKAIVFISNDEKINKMKEHLAKKPSLQKEYDYLYTHFNSCIQSISVAKQQFGLGDPLTPGSGSDASNDYINRGKLSDSKMVPKLITIPVSIDQIRGFYDHLVADSNNHVLIDLTVKLETFTKHPTMSLLAKIEGKEQNNKAIVIASARDSYNNGAQYPNFGTASLLSLGQLFQQLKFKYKWKPLRNIYLISYDATVYNMEGPTEILEAKLSSIVEEVYTLVDISGLNINSNGVNIQATPILHDAIKKMNEKFDIRVNLENVKSYGTWSPYMAVGMPVIAIGDNTNKIPYYSNLDVWEGMYEMIHREYPNGDIGYERISRLLLFVLELVLDIADDPIIPFNFNDFKNDLSFKLQDLMAMYEHYIKESSEITEVIDFNKISLSLMNWQYVINDWESLLRMWDQIVVAEGSNQEPSLIAMHRWSWNRRLSIIPFKQVSENGISEDRKFYKNLFYGPALYSERDFDWWTFPGIRDAIRAKNWKRVKEQVDLASMILDETSRLFRDEGI
ncbi:unnamed protein product [Hanseniaspora opuntiae]